MTHFWPIFYKLPFVGFTKFWICQSAHLFEWNTWKIVSVAICFRLILKMTVLIRPVLFTWQIIFPFPFQFSFLPNFFSLCFVSVSSNFSVSVSVFVFISFSVSVSVSIAFLQEFLNYIMHFMNEVKVYYFILSSH